MIHSTITELGMFFVGVEELLSFYWWIVSLAFSRSSQNAVSVDNRSTFYVVDSLGHNYYGVYLGDSLDFSSPRKLGGACMPKFSTNFGLRFSDTSFSTVSQMTLGEEKWWSVYIPFRSKLPLNPENDTLDSPHFRIPFALPTTTTTTIHIGCISYWLFSVKCVKTKNIDPEKHQRGNKESNCSKIIFSLCGVFIF